MTHPPVLARSILGRLLPGGTREEILSDLDDLFADRLERVGRTRAWLWYWQQIPSFAWRLSTERAGHSKIRPARRLSSLDTLRQDAVVAARGLRRSKALCLAVVSTLALGIGANAAIFAAVYGVVLKPVHGADLIRVWPEHNFTRESYVAFRDRLRSLEHFSAYLPVRLALTSDGEPDIVPGLAVTSNHFLSFGTSPALGRFFTDDDALPGAEPVVILSHGLWQRRFNGDENMLGHVISLGGFEAAQRKIVGVAPAGLRPLTLRPDVWVPVTLDPDDDEYVHMANLSGVARLGAGFEIAQARAELETVARAIQPPPYYLDRVTSYSLVTAQEDVVGGVKPTLLLLFAAVGIVLLLCCTNVANLLLAHGASRERELGIRAALGATRSRVARQLLTEHAMLGLLGGGLGIVLVWLTFPFLRALLPANVPRVEELAFDGAVVPFTLCVSMVASLLFGLFPTLRALASAETGCNEHVRGNGSSTRDSVRWSHALVTAEVALAVVLLVAAGLVSMSFLRLSRVETGFHPDRLLTLNLASAGGRFAEPENRRTFMREVTEQVASLPGVRGVGAIHLLPMTPPNMGVGISPDGEPIPAGTTPPTASYRVITPGYLSAMGIRLLRGRDLDARDRASSIPVGLVNETLARRLVPDANPVGQQLHYDDGSVWFDIVGVVSDVRQHRFDLDVREEAYVPFEQDAWPSSMYLVVRTPSDPSALVDSIRDAIRSIDASVPVTSVATMEGVIYESMARPRFRMQLFSAFAVLGLVLSGVGIYGVTAYAVTRRTHEIGIRMALGATKARILAGTMLKETLPVAAGLALGAVVSLVAGDLLSGFLFEIEPGDPVIVVCVLFFLSAVAALACYVPARRAAVVDPMDSLNTEI